MNVSTLSNAVTLQDLLLTCGRRRGWRTQRHIAVSCELDETAYSRFVHGEQEIGATRTYALFRAVGVPVERIDLAYTLLEQAQRLARRPAGSAVIRPHRDVAWDARSHGSIARRLPRHSGAGALYGTARRRRRDMRRAIRLDGARYPLYHGIG